LSAANYGDSLEFFRDKAITATETGAWIGTYKCGALRRAKEIVLFLDVTAAAAGVGDTLDVKIQEGLMGASSIIPHDRAHFTQVLGNGGAKQFIAKITTDAAVSGTGAPSVALGVNTVVDGPISDLLRFVITVAGGTAAFTATLTAYVKG